MTSLYYTKFAFCIIAYLPKSERFITPLSVIIPQKAIFVNKQPFLKSLLKFSSGIDIFS